MFSEEASKKGGKIIQYLLGKGVKLDQIGKMIPIIISLIKDGGSFTVSLINYELKKQGCAAEIDEDFFELFLDFTQEAFEYQVKTSTLH